MAEFRRIELDEGFQLWDRKVLPNECIIRHETVDGSADHKVTPRAMEVLVHLAAHPGKVIPADRLLDELWSSSFPTPNAVQKCIAELRHALHDDAKRPTYIQTFPKRGYKLLIPPSPTPSRSSETRPKTDRRAVSLSNSATPTGQHLKYSIARLAGVALSIGALATAAIFLARAPTQTLEPEGAAHPSIRTVVVRQFQATGTASEQSYLGLGLSTAMLEALAKLPNIQTIPWEGAEARQTTGDYVLSGTLEEENDRLRTTVRLIRVSDSVQIYADTFDNVSVSIFDIQDAIASRVADALRVYLDESERRKMLDWGTTDPAAYLLAREADYEWKIFGSKATESALQKIDEAIRLDPQFLPAYEIAALNLGNMAWYGSEQDAQTYRRRVTELRRQAELIDPEWSGLITLRLIEERLHGSIRGAEAELRRKILKNQPLKTGNPDGLYDYARLLKSARLFELAAAYFRKFNELAYPDVWENDLPEVQIWLEGPEKAIETAKRIVPDAGVGVMTALVMYLGLDGRFAEAKRYLQMLEAEDKRGAWSHSAATALAILEGRIVYGTPEFDVAIGNDLVGDFTRGAWCFMLAEVQAGTEYWRELSGRDYQLAAWYTPTIEALFPSETREDPEYRRAISSLGLGKRWTDYMLARARELEPVTGIRVSALSAYTDSSAPNRSAY